MHRLFALLVIIGSLVTPAFAQVRVELKIPRRIYLCYEPIIATVTVTNVAGRDLMLADTESQQWFLFQVRTGDDRPIGARDPNYEVPPVRLPAGQTIKRTVNLTQLYPIDEFGFYRIRAAIYLADVDRYFSSAPDGVEISEGRTFWQQTVGVAGADGGNGGTREISMLEFRRPKDNYLYVRIADVDGGKILCAYPLGRLISGNPPVAKLDRENNLHVLQVVGPKAYAYSIVGVNGEWLGQKQYVETKTRPRLAATADGSVEIKGGEESKDPAAAGPGDLPTPKLSDKPPGLPSATPEKR